MKLRDKYITVTALTKYLKKKMDIDPHLQQIFLKGEISNFKHHTRGHMYMTIKDGASQIRAVMFAGDNTKLRFLPEDGMKVFLQGNVSVFEAYGQYQLYIREMEPDGKGALFLAYEQVKKRLASEGLFNQDMKKTIPAFPDHIAVITSPTGAAVKDIITTINRRYPIASVTVFPVLVQGEGAVPSIMEGIQKAQVYPGINTIIIGRGGGSIEDLWAFNDEGVARAIFHCSIPVISGIGHETDYTISDFTSDLRAPTPTAAAELAVPSLMELKNDISKLQARLTREMNSLYIAYKRSLKEIKNNIVFRKPMQMLEEKEQYLDRLSEEMLFHTKRIYRIKASELNELNIHLQHKSPARRLQELNSIKQNLIDHMTREQHQIIYMKRQKLYTLIEKLALLNPLEIMKRGFAIAYDENEKLLKSVKSVHVDEQISLKLIDGTLSCSVEKVGRE